MKALFTIALGFVFALVVSTMPVGAQVSEVKAINSGILNGKALKLPKPEYPQTAKDAGIEGVVAVSVEIDEQGNVVSAEADIHDRITVRSADGSSAEPVVAHPLLRQAAEEAARQAKFSPMQLGGVPLRVKGWITYNFVANTSVATSNKTVSQGVLNGKALSLPIPEYPAAGKAVQASGSVSIQVVIDENGDVISASAVSGHPLLRQASENAAFGAKFKPTVLSGQSVKVSGVLTYNFVP